MKKVDVREKLIELLTAYFGVDPAYYGIEAQHLADHLIANGVTLNVRDCHWATEQAYKNGYKQGKQDAVVHGRWETEMDDMGWLKHTCPICGYVKRTDIHVRLGWDYCPKCGAKMDAEETKSSGISQRTVQALERMGQKVHKNDF